MVWKRLKTVLQSLSPFFNISRIFSWIYGCSSKDCRSCLHCVVIQLSCGVEWKWCEQFLDYAIKGEGEPLFLQAASWNTVVVAAI